MTVKMIVQLGIALALCIAVLLTAAWRQSDRVPLGFSRGRGEAHAELERRFLSLPSTDRIREAHRFLASKPHPAGSARDGELAQWVRERFEEFGLEDVTIVTHDVLLPWPEEVSVEMLAPKRWRASMREEPVPGDADTHAPAVDIGIAYHAYSASGEVTAPVVYAGGGNPADYDWLQSQGIDVRGKIALVRYSMPYSYRGFKAWTAEQRGVAGLLIYSDPAEDGYGKGKVYPEGPWGPDSHIQRGGIVYDFLVPGDPLTPGWASVPDAPRIAASEAVSLPRIVSAPLSHNDARVILESLGGSQAPAAWGGALPITYRAGPGPAQVRLRVRTDNRVRPIWTVTGRIRGSDEPDAVVIVGNHRDAWVFGGVDPSSGSATLIELARSLGELKRAGWRPKRSILLASWDAEEFALTSSTEWGEQHRDSVQKNAVAYVNVDSAASGSDLSIAAVPSFNPLIEEVARAVRDPATRLTLAARARDRARRERSAPPAGSAEDFVRNRLGSGSDYTVFLHHLGVPVADLSFDGPYGVYHSVYDTHEWVARLGDPGFRYHAAMVRLWGLTTLRLAEADVIPLDYEPYARRIEEFTREIRRGAANHGPREQAQFAEIHDATDEFLGAAIRFNARRAAAVADPTPGHVDRLNRQLQTVERALLDPAGLPGRAWYRHLIYAPKFTYEPQVLPGIASALESSNSTLLSSQAQRLTAALRRAAAALDGN
jgi:N-acetylated-alpha-linked acidic dipeptidase